MQASMRLKNTPIRSVLILTVILLFPLFFLGGADGRTARSVTHLRDAGHAVFFALAAWLLLAYCKPLAKKSLPVQFAFIVLLAAAAGMSIEALQTLVGRTFDQWDLLRNLIGSITGMLVFSSHQGGLTPHRRVAARLLAAAILLPLAYPLAASLADEWRARKTFPVLADFEGRHEISRWTGTAKFAIVHDQTGKGNHYLETSLETTPYSGVFMKYFPRDWNGFSTLAFTLFNPSPGELQITCRVHDLRHTMGRQLFHDRFNRVLHLKPGFNRYEIPLRDIFNAPESRTMEPDQIGALGFFASNLKKTTSIHLDDLRLQ